MHYLHLLWSYLVYKDFSSHVHFILSGLSATSARHSLWVPVYTVMYVKTLICVWDVMRASFSHQGEYDASRNTSLGTPMPKPCS